MTTTVIEASTITVSRSQIVAAKREKSELVEAGQQLFAAIKKSSKYYGQGTKGELFPVRVMPGYDLYCVHGGPGGMYRLSDVNLYVVEDGHTLRIS